MDSEIYKITDSRSLQDTYIRAESESQAIWRYCEINNLALIKQDIIGFTAVSENAGTGTELLFRCDELEVIS